MERPPSRHYRGRVGKNAPLTKSSSAVTEEAPSLVLHIDVDRGLTLSSKFARHVATTDRTDIRLETATATEYASHLLAEFTWGTLDPNNGSWLPVGGIPSCLPPNDDDSLITYGEYLRAQHTAEPLENPQVCENVRKALQTFGQPSPRRAQPQGGGQRRRARPGTKTVSNLAEATPGEAALNEEVVDMHAQLLKRMMLPLTLRLALGCEKANPAQPLDVDEIFKATNSETRTSASHAVVDGRTLADSASLGNPAETALDPSSSPVKQQKEEKQKSVRRTYIERLREGYWHIAPSIFHTLFAWLKRKKTLKVVLYTRDYLGGPHITRVIEEFNDLCEGKHPAFDGQNRTKQVFLDGRKKTKDMRVSPSQVGSVTLCVRRPSVSPLSTTSANEHSSLVPRGEEPFLSPCVPSSFDARISCVPHTESFSPRTNPGDGSNYSSTRNSCLQCSQEYSQASSAAESSPSPAFTWQAEFPSANRIYSDMHEVYTGLVYELLAAHNVVCLCFGSRVPASASYGASPSEAAKSSKPGSPRAEAESPGSEFSAAGLPASETETWLHAAAARVNESKPNAPQQECSQHSQTENSQIRQSRPPTAQKTGIPHSRPLSAVVNKELTALLPSGEKCSPLKDALAPSESEQVLPRQPSSSFSSSSSTGDLRLYPIFYSMNAPLVPLPVIVDPVDYSLFHVCISAPAILSVQHGLSYLPSLEVVEVVRGDTIFGATPPLTLSRCPGANAEASSLPRAAQVVSRCTRLRQSHFPAADVAPTGVTEKDARNTHLRRSNGQLLHSLLTETIVGPPSPLVKTFRGAYLVVSTAYCVIITEPCSLLCNPEHLLGLTEQCIECRLKQLKEGKTEKDTVVLAVEKAQQTLTPVAATMIAHETGVPGAAQATATERDIRLYCSKEKTSAKSTEGEAAAGLPEKMSLSEAATRRTTLKCLDPYADLTAEEIKALHPRDYLKATIVPVLLPALEYVLRDRPEDPLSWMAFYLLRHAEGYERRVL